MVREGGIGGTSMCWRRIALQVIADTVGGRTPCFAWKLREPISKNKQHTEPGTNESRVRRVCRGKEFSWTG